MTMGDCYEFQSQKSPLLIFLSCMIILMFYF